jgi:rubrerythrin
MKEMLINFLKEDLKNERKHMMFYLQAAACVKGINRGELKKIFKNEAADELNHVFEFSELIFQLEGEPSNGINYYPPASEFKSASDYILYAIKMEEEVVNIYSDRIDSIDGNCSVSKYVKLFYEEQLKDSKKTVLELSLFL